MLCSGLYCVAGLGLSGRCQWTMFGLSCVAALWMPGNVLGLSCVVALRLPGGVLGLSSVVILCRSWVAVLGLVGCILELSGGLPSSYIRALMCCCLGAALGCVIVPRESKFLRSPHRVTG